MYQPTSEHQRTYKYRKLSLRSLTSSFKKSAYLMTWQYMMYSHLQIHTQCSMFFSVSWPGKTTQFHINAYSIMIFGEWSCILLLLLTTIRSPCLLVILPGTKHPSPSLSLPASAEACERWHVPRISRVRCFLADETATVENPGRLKAWFTYSHHPFRKEKDRNQTSIIIFQLLIFRGVNFCPSIKILVRQ